VCHISCQYHSSWQSNVDDDDGERKSQSVDELHVASCLAGKSCLWRTTSEGRSPVEVTTTLGPISERGSASVGPIPERRPHDSVICWPGAECSSATSNSCQVITFHYYYFYYFQFLFLFFQRLLQVRLGPQRRTVGDEEQSSLQAGCSIQIR